MNKLILTVYELVTAFVPFGVAILLYDRNCKKDRAKGHNGIYLIAFAIYVSAVFYFTGISTLYDIKRTGLEIQRDQINLIPFSHGIDRTPLLLNVLMFVPFGFLLPLIWPQCRRLWRTVISGFTFSLLIETAQLFNNRRTDVDDLMMNTLGALIGYLAYRLLALLLGARTPKRTIIAAEPIFYITIMFLGRFLLFNGYGLAKVLYGFQ